MRQRGDRRLLDFGFSLKEDPALEDLNVSVWLLVEGHSSRSRETS